MQTDPDLTKWVWNNKLNERILAGHPYVGAEAAKETLQYLKGVLNVGSPEDRAFATTNLDGRDGTHSKIFCHKGLMGMGKTRLHNELCSSESAVGRGVVAAMAEAKKPVKFIRMTYNEQHDIPETLRGPPDRGTFMRQLLNFHGLHDAEAAKVRTAADAVGHIRDMLTMQDDTTLVVCVDELMKMPCDLLKTHENGHCHTLGRLICDLVVMQDSTRDSKQPLVFLFSAVTAQGITGRCLFQGTRGIPASCT